MKSKLNKTPVSGLTLIEVLVTMAVITTGIVMVFNSFNTCLNASAFSRRVSRACFLAEGKFWEAGQYRNRKIPFPASGAVGIEGKEFKWSQVFAADAEFNKISDLRLEVSWQEKGRGDYALDFSKYFLDPE